MPKQNKPIPKTTDQIINYTIVPYDLLNVGNPNVNPINRGNDISVRNDVVKEIKIGLMDMYDALTYYIKNVIKPIIVENGQQISVPVEYVFQERWNAVQKEGFLRDKEGRVLLPLIVIKRDTIVPNRALGNKLDGNRVHNYQTFQTKYTRKNQYDNFAILTNRIPVRENHMAPVPDYVTVTYNVSILTNNQEQSDKVIESFNYARDSYWGRYDRYKFKVNIESFTDSIEYSQGEDRSIRCNFNIVMNGYLLPDSINRETSTKKKTLSKASLKFTMETTSSDLDEFSFSNVVNPNNIPVTIIDSLNHSGPSINSNISPDIISYINSNIELDAISGSVNGNTATFAAGFLSAPAGIPATSLSNFIFFSNGQYIPSGSIVSFIDNGNNTSTLTVNTGSVNTGGLGYSFGSDWEITSKGKYA